MGSYHETLIEEMNLSFLKDIRVKSDRGVSREIIYRQFSSIYLLRGSGGAMSGMHRRHVHSGDTGAP